MKMSKTTFINAILIDPKSNTVTNGSLTIEDGFIDKINGPSKATGKILVKPVIIPNNTSLSQ